MDNVNKEAEMLVWHRNENRTWTARHGCRPGELERITLLGHTNNPHGDVALDRAIGEFCDWVRDMRAQGVAVS